MVQLRFSYLSKVQEGYTFRRNCISFWVLLIIMTLFIIQYPRVSIQPHDHKGKQQTFKGPVVLRQCSVVWVWPIYFLPLQLAKGVSGHSITRPKEASVLFLKDVCRYVCWRRVPNTWGEGQFPVAARIGRQLYFIKPPVGKQEVSRVVIVQVNNSKPIRSTYYCLKI